STCTYRVVRRRRCSSSPACSRCSSDEPNRRSLAAERRLTPSMTRRDRARQPFYGPDLAFIHDAGFGAVAAAAARRLERHLATHRLPDGALVDLGCGSGTLAAALAKLGRPIVGIDASPAMVALARQAAPGARFEVGSVYGAAIPEAAVVTAVGETFNYVLPGSRAPSLEPIFRRVARALLPGGLFLLDLVTGP